MEVYSLFFLGFSSQFPIQGLQLHLTLILQPFHLKFYLLGVKKELFSMRNVLFTYCEVPNSA